MMLSASEQIIADGLDPLLLPRMLRHREAVLAAGIPFSLISGRRGHDHQLQLRERYERRLREWEESGRQGDPPRPAARPGTSKHELGMAYDYTGPRTDAEWRQAGELAEDAGLESGHRYNDPGHVELPESMAALKELVRLRLLATLAALGIAWGAAR